jgi:excisionase family DNA binding protein
MKEESDALLSTAEVGARLGVTRQRVLELITEGRLSAMKVGRAYIIRAGDVASLDRLRVGRPKTTPDANKRATSPVSRGNEASTGKRKGKK